MKLSHTTKVVVRKALKALVALDLAEDTQRALLTQHGFQVINSPSKPKLTTLIARKAGFRNRAELEAFAIKHHLL